MQSGALWSKADDFRVRLLGERVSGGQVIAEDAEGEDSVGAAGKPNLTKFTGVFGVVEGVDDVNVVAAGPSASYLYRSANWSVRP
jgi:hypothetical protein